MKSTKMVHLHFAIGPRDKCRSEHIYSDQLSSEFMEQAFHVCRKCWPREAFSVFVLQQRNRKKTNSTKVKVKPRNCCKPNFNGYNNTVISPQRVLLTIIRSQLHFNPESTATVNHTFEL